MNIKVYFDNVAPVPRLEYTSKMLKSVESTPDGIKAEVVDHSVARMKFRIDKPSVVIGASSYSVKRDGSVVECRVEGSGTVSVIANASPIRITSTTLPIVKFADGKVTVKSNGKKHNKLVYQDASGNRVVKKIEQFNGEKTIAL